MNVPRKHRRQLAKGTFDARVAAEAARRHQGRRPHLRVHHSAAAIVHVPDCLEQVVDNAVECSRVIDRRSPPTFAKTDEVEGIFLAFKGQVKAQPATWINYLEIFPPGREYSF
jgi:hypothetical protein